MDLQRTKLFDSHQELKAKLAPFAGFEMPIQYTSVKDEVFSVRNHVGIFDVSHMGEFFIEGEEASHFVDYLVTNDIKGAAAGRAIYTPLCREDGTVVDDMIVYKISMNKILLCVNASNMQKDWEHINRIKGTTHFKCTLTNHTDDYSLIAIQGPKAARMAIDAGILSVGEESGFAYYGVMEATYQQKNIIVARTGYTGEDGFELFCDHESARKLWKKFLEMGAAPCGLAARDVLRLEVCFPLYGHELSDEVTPLDSGLKWTVKAKASGFIGKAALDHYKAKYHFIKLLLPEGVPRQGYVVEDETNQEVGVITSGTMSPTIGKGVALAHICKGKVATIDKNKKFWIIIRGKRYEAKLQEKAFIIGGHK
ncbi:MAG: glycine cleavage system aminomethyltransferase GcvT [Oligoflexia bacterium]|nr:glycine cleavage system aminomethyltransferase GcvT [Oligoflexia bacterium]